jgi:hypothetical protein
LDENKAKNENKDYQQYAEDPKLLKALGQYQSQMQEYQMMAQQAQQAGSGPVANATSTTNAGADFSCS